MKNKKANRFTFDSRIDYGLILPAFMLILIGLYALYVAVSLSLIHIFRKLAHEGKIPGVKKSSW